MESLTKTNFGPVLGTGQNSADLRRELCTRLIPHIIHHLPYCIDLDLEQPGVGMNQSTS